MGSSGRKFLQGHGQDVALLWYLGLTAFVLPAGKSISLLLTHTKT